MEGTTAHRLTHSKPIALPPVDLALLMILILILLFIQTETPLSYSLLLALLRRQHLDILFSYGFVLLIWG